MNTEAASTSPMLTTGAPQPLGAHWDGHGVNLAVYSRHAARVEWCLFDADGTRETARLVLPGHSGEVWHGYLEGAGPGLVYGLRAYGPYMPRQGHRFNPRKLLIDPYARELCGDFIWDDAVLGYATGDPHDAATPDTRDSAPYVPKCRVAAPLPTLAQRPPRPCTPWRDTVIYETHVKGFSMRHPGVPAALRGTLAALAEPVSIAHWRELGITAIELLPIAAFLDERQLVRRKLNNYWGYNPVAPLPIHRAYLAEGDASEMVRVVDRLHEAGLEIILDVVFNHTAETDAFGPTLSLRGLDNATYYQLPPDHPELYLDYSGCGNTLDCAQPAVIALVHAALRYWACEIGVDGFRFDLAAALARDTRGVPDAQSALWRTIADDPQLRQLKLIVEPWDAMAHGHCLGEFPAPFSEWNDRYRDGVRRFWRGDAGMRAELATRLAGSSDIFAHSGRPPSAGTNFITAHDGFTLADLTAYRTKHNLINGDDDRDGATENWSSNLGVEGATDDAGVLAARRRLRCALLGTLLLSRGVPMVLGGDELSRTQWGNNNAYCQDNEVSWLDWTAQGDTGRDLRAFVRQAIRLRRELPFAGEQRFFTGACDEHGEKDIRWLQPDGRELETDDWRDAAQHGLGVLLTSGQNDGQVRERLFIALNAGDAPLSFRMPSCPDVEAWIVVLDSDAVVADAAARRYDAGSTVTVPPHGLLACVPHRSVALGVAVDLAAQAHAASISETYSDATGIQRQVPASSLRALIASAVQTAIPIVTASVPAAHAATCHLPASLATPPGRWALSAPLYSLRSRDNWGIGDFADLAKLARVMADMGADGIQLSPLHALSLARPERASPYSPDSRTMLNPLYISVPQAAGSDPPEPYLAFLDHPDTRAELTRLQSATLVDHPSVARLKRHALELLYQAFRHRHLHAQPSAEGVAFERFGSEQGAAAYRYGVFQAIRHHVDTRQGRAVPWMAWPAGLRDPDSPEVAAFAHQHATEVNFHVYLQWLARRQWQHAAACAKAAGMQLGLMTDLALGAAPDSAETWQWPGLAALDVELGAPPDAFAARGQCWGISPWRPQRLMAMDFAPFDALLDAAMRHAGAMRLDHVMGLMRQFWVPRGEDAAHGAYMAYPFEALLQRLAQASLRHRCTVIGEDLGVVPGGLRERMSAAHMLGYRVLYFERDASGRFVAPEQYAALSAAVVSTHDLPTITGFVQQLDIQERCRLGLYASAEQVRLAQAQRGDALETLAAALAPYAQSHSRTIDAAAAHRFLAACASRLCIVQIENILDLPRQFNLPGMGDEPPNWRQRLPLDLESFQSDARLKATADIFSARAHKRSGTLPP